MRRPVPERLDTALPVVAAAVVVVDGVLYGGQARLLPWALGLLAAATLAVR